MSNITKRQPDIVPVAVNLFMSTIGEAWLVGRQVLHLSPSPALDARLLLEHVLGCSHPHLIAHSDQILTDFEDEHYRELLGRAARFEPIPYIIGKAPFFGLEIQVSSDVLIPRPETEQLVETAVRWGRNRGPIRVVDTGTGSGCIAVAVALNLPDALVVGIDISAAALAVARANVSRLAPGKVSLVQSDLLSSVGPGLDLVLGNLPYITESEWTGLDDGVKSYEPVLALKGGADGLDLVKIVLSQAVERLHSGGLVILEIGWQQGQAAKELARASFPDANVEVVPDFAGNDRVLIVHT